jgi:hypothetical protein
MRALLPLAFAASALGVSAPGALFASELSWDGPADCAERERLLFEVERALGRPLSELGQLTFQVRIDTSKATRAARLNVRGPATGSTSEERVLVASDCATLVDTLAVAISLALGNSTTSSTAREPRSEAPAPAATPTLHSGEPIDVPPKSIGDSSRREPTGLDLGVTAALLGDVGSLPAPAIGASLGVELGWPRLWLHAFGTMLFPQVVELQSGSAAGAEVDLVTGTLRVCTDALLGVNGTLALPLCAGGEVGRLGGIGRSVSRAREAGILWLAPRLDAGVTWRIPGTRLEWSALLAALAPLNRDEFVIDELGAVHRPSSVVGRISSGVSLEF